MAFFLPCRLPRAAPGYCLTADPNEAATADG